MWCIFITSHNYGLLFIPRIITLNLSQTKPTSAPFSYNYNIDLSAQCLSLGIVIQLFSELVFSSSPQKTIITRTKIQKYFTVRKLSFQLTSLWKQIRYRVDSLHGLYGNKRRWGCLHWVRSKRRRPRFDFPQVWKSFLHEFSVHNIGNVIGYFEQNRETI